MTSGPVSPANVRGRLDPELFGLPTEEIKSGYYTDKYFVRARDILTSEGMAPTSTFGRIVSIRINQRDHAT